MPPALHAPALPPEKIDVIRRWIEQGGEWQPHWAYRLFHEVTPPVVSDEARVRNPIDRFVLAGLEREGLTPSPEADRHTLIRRVSLVRARVSLRCAGPSGSWFEADTAIVRS